ncbi:uncharacterized protein CLUP02_10406 [Colletotrichum lupini]|uniref:Uncharacterized protein n=1 Tax=Colletotrichum lupini TaxID=145971 RepID=A0A9Q8SXG7_9PEZI|nr:uncharacterized protein CLUP02_10406 [Colletotrichum lupini]UQC84910.1 hypothetical protein CLUP02_10406 [Colletotrichum lupini]
MNTEIPWYCTVAEGRREVLCSVSGQLQAFLASPDSILTALALIRTSEWMDCTCMAGKAWCTAILGWEGTCLTDNGRGPASAPTVFCSSIVDCLVAHSLFSLPIFAPTPSYGWPHTGRENTHLGSLRDAMPWTLAMSRLGSQQQNQLVLQPLVSMTPLAATRGNNLQREYQYTVPLPSTHGTSPLARPSLAHWHSHRLQEGGDSEQLDKLPSLLPSGSRPLLQSDNGQNDVDCACIGKDNGRLRLEPLEVTSDVCQVLSPSFPPPNDAPAAPNAVSLPFLYEVQLEGRHAASWAHLAHSLLPLPIDSQEQQVDVQVVRGGAVRYYGDLPLALPHCGPACPGGLPALASESPLLHLPPAIRGGKPLPLILGNSCFSRPFLPSTVFSPPPCTFEPKRPWITSVVSISNTLSLSDSKYPYDYIRNQGLPRLHRDYSRIVIVCVVCLLRPNQPCLIVPGKKQHQSRRRHVPPVLGTLSEPAILLSLWNPAVFDKRHLLKVRVLTGTDRFGEEEGFPPAQHASGLLGAFAIATATLHIRLHAAQTATQHCDMTEEASLLGTDNMPVGVPPIPPSSLAVSLSRQDRLRVTALHFCSSSTGSPYQRAQIEIGSSSRTTSGYDFNISSSIAVRSVDFSMPFDVFLFTPMARSQIMIPAGATMFGKTLGLLFWMSHARHIAKFHRLQPVSASFDDFVPHLSFRCNYKAQACKSLIYLSLNAENHISTNFKYLSATVPLSLSTGNALRWNLLASSVIDPSHSPTQRSRQYASLGMATFLPVVDKQAAKLQLDAFPSSARDDSLSLHTCCILLRTVNPPNSLLGPGEGFECGLERQQNGMSRHLPLLIAYGWALFRDLMNCLIIGCERLTRPIDIKRVRVRSNYQRPPNLDYVGFRPCKEDFFVQLRTVPAM